MPRLAVRDKARLEESRRAQILTAAAKVFARRGYNRATIAEIAKASHLSEGSIYNYFRSKEDLLVHIPRHFVQPVLVPLLEQVPTPDSVEDVERQLRMLMTAMVERFRANARFLKVFLSAMPTLSMQAREEYIKVLPVYAFELLERFLRTGRSRGLFRSDLDPMVAARALPGMLMMFVFMQEVFLDRPLIARTYDQIIPDLVRIFLFGVTRREETQT